MHGNRWNRPDGMRASALAVAVALWLGIVAPAGAVEALRPTLRGMAEQLQALLKGRGEKALYVGSFTGSFGKSRAPASAGSGIKGMLIEELKQCGIEIRSDANLEVKGDYRDVTDPKSSELMLRLRAEVLDRNGNALVVLGKAFVLDEQVEDCDVLVQVLGVNKPDLGGGLTRAKESDALRKRLDEPTVDLRGTLVSTGAKSEFGVEILVKSGGGYRPVQPASERGLAYVPLGQDDVFAVRLINNADFDAAVELTLDGLNMFAFSENRGYRHVIVPRHRATVIKGWHRSNQVSDEFKITSYARSAAAELLASQDEVGTITAVFSAAWTKEEGPPRDEQSKFRDPFAPAVGRGEPVKAAFKEVSREHGRVRDVVNVRYRRPAQ